MTFLRDTHNNIVAGAASVADGGREPRQGSAFGETAEDAKHSGEESIVNDPVGSCRWRVRDLQPGSAEVQRAGDNELIASSERNLEEGAGGETDVAHREARVRV